MTALISEWKQLLKADDPKAPAGASTGNKRPRYASDLLARPSVRTQIDKLGPSPFMFHNMQPWYINTGRQHHRHSLAFGDLAFITDRQHRWLHLGLTVIIPTFTSDTVKDGRGTSVTLKVERGSNNFEPDVCFAYCDRDSKDVPAPGVSATDDNKPAAKVKGGSDMQRSAV